MRGEKKESHRFDLVEESEKLDDSLMVDVVQDGDLVLEDARLGLKVLESRLVDDLDGHFLIVSLADAGVHLAELARSEQLLRVDLELVVHVLLRDNMLLSKSLYHKYKATKRDRSWPRYLFLVFGRGDFERHATGYYFEKIQEKIPVQKQSASATHNERTTRRKIPF